MAVNRSTYHKVIDDNIGLLADGIFRKSSPNYKNPGYPAYNPTKAKALVDAYKAANNVSTVSFVIDIVAGSSSETERFSLFQQEFAKIGVNVTPRSSVQSALINNVIYGEYDCATWNQFGGVDPSLNYVWFDSQSATAGLAAGGLGMSGLPAGTQIAGAVNFAHQADPVVESALLAALAAKPGSAAQHTGWQTVNRRFSALIPYVFLDTLVNAWPRVPTYRTGSRARPGTARLVASALTVDPRAGTKSGRANSSAVVLMKGGACAALHCVLVAYCVSVILPVTRRHHQRVVTASEADTMAITVKGSAELMVKRNPETPAATASAAVFDVA